MFGCKPGPKQLLKLVVSAKFGSYSIFAILLEEAHLDPKNKLFFPTAGGFFAFNQTQTLWALRHIQWSQIGGALKIVKIWILCINM